MMHKDDDDNQPLSMMAFKEIPEANENAEQIVALVKSDGRVTGYQLSDGRMVTKEEGIALAKNGGIEGVGVATNKGGEYLKTLPDDHEGNNLSHLPSVTED